MVAASAFLLSSAYKVSVFSEINPVPPYCLSRKVFPLESSSDSQC